MLRDVAMTMSSEARAEAERREGNGTGRSRSATRWEWLRKRGALGQPREIKGQAKGKRAIASRGREIQAKETE